jgi:metal-responsive CopG/Arc/MetJ family transcriptional regulator
MKATISIPDEVFQDAEALARHLSVSRSKLYSRALREYISRHAPDSVTEVLDRLCGELDGAAGPFVAAAARRTLERTEW